MQTLFTTSTPYFYKVWWMGNGFGAVPPWETLNPQLQNEWETLAKSWNHAVPDEVWALYKKERDKLEAPSLPKKQYKCLNSRETTCSFVTHI